MTVHTVHPDSHAYGLADDCERCAEHAKNPINTLDAANIRLLVQRVQNNAPARSNNEATAMENIRTALEHAASLFSVDPSGVLRYMADRHIPIRLTTNEEER